MGRVNTWTAFSMLGAVVMGGGLFLAPFAQARGSLPREDAQVLFARARRAAAAGNFSETLQIAGSGERFGLGAGEGRRRLVNFYDHSPRDWRIQVLTPAGAVLADAACVHGAITADGFQSTAAVTAPRGFGGAVSWIIPQVHEARDWQSKVRQTALAGVPAYQVTLARPAVRSPFSAIVYWFHAATGQPMGAAFYRAGRMVFEAKAVAYSAGNPGAAVKPASGAAQGVSAALEAFPVPARFGPLPRTSVERRGSQEMVRYGRGISQVMVTVSAGTAAGTPAWRFTEPVSGFPGYTGMTDGLWSALALRHGAYAITVVSDRDLAVLARWARQAFGAPS